MQVARRNDGATGWAVHNSDILFTFVMAGNMRLTAAGRDPVTLAPGDAFVTPPGLAVRYETPSADLELLEVSLPGVFQTQMVDPA